MKKSTAAAAAAGGLAAANLLGAWALYDLCTKRPPSADPDAPLEKGAYKDYIDEIKRGKEWFMAQSPETVCLRSRDGLLLKAYVLEAENACGTAVLMHGYRSTALKDFGCAVGFYHSLGLNLLLPDERACGRSEGKRITFGVLEREDCADWAAYAAARWTDKPIVLGGVSMGCSTVLMATELPLPKQVKAVIADCGYTTPWAIVCKVLRKSFHLPVFPLAYIANGFAKLNGRFSLNGASALEAAGKCRLPVLFVHGEADQFVPHEMTVQCYSACHSPKTLISVPGAGHALSYLVDRPRCEAALRRFLLRSGIRVKPEKQR